MKAMLKSATTLVAALFFAAAPAEAQGLEFGAGLTALAGLNGGGTSIGAIGTIAPRSENQLRFRGDLQVFFESGTPLMGVGNVIYGLKSAEGGKFRPYLIAGGGYATLLDDFGSGDFMIGAGAGSKMELTSMTLFGEAKFVNQFASGASAQYLQLTAGISLPHAR